MAVLLAIVITGGQYVQQNPQNFEADLLSDITLFYYLGILFAGLLFVTDIMVVLVYWYFSLKLGKSLFCSACKHSIELHNRELDKCRKVSNNPKKLKDWQNVFFPEYCKCGKFEQEIKPSKKHPELIAVAIILMVVFMIVYIALVSPTVAETQAKEYAESLKTAYVILSA